MVGLEMFYGDNRDDTHMFQIIKARDVAQHIIRRKVTELIVWMIVTTCVIDWFLTDRC